MHFLFYKLTFNFKKKNIFACVQRPPGGLKPLNMEACSSWTWRPAAPEHGGLQLLNMEAYPKNPKTCELSYKNDNSPNSNNLSSQFKNIKPRYTHCYANVSKLPLPLLSIINYQKIGDTIFLWFSLIFCSMIHLLAKFLLFLFHFKWMFSAISCQCLKKIFCCKSTL